MKIRSIFKKNYLIFFFIILIFGVFIRFYKLAEFPNGLYTDETAIGYNAYSILETGKDEYGVSYPLYFKSFNDYKLPVYIYLTTLSIKSFGLNAFAVRFPSFLFGSIALPIFYLLLLEISKRKEVALAGMFLLSINPWHIFFSRAGLEVNVALTFSLLGMLFFYYALRKHYLFYFFSIFSFCISLYTYNVARLLAPGLFIVLVLLNFKKLKQLETVRKFFISIFFIILLTPFLITLFFSSGLSMQKDLFISGGSSLANILELRSYFISMPWAIDAIFFNKWIVIFWTYLENIVKFFSVNFYFISGDIAGHFGVGNVGMFYLWELPLVILGVTTILKKKLSEWYLFFAWFAITLAVVCLNNEVPHSTRGYFILTPILVFSSLGLVEFIHIASQQKFKQILLGISSLVVLYSIVFFLSSYFYRFPIFYSRQWREADQQLALYLKDNENRYNRVIIDRDADFIYTSLLFYQQLDPQYVQENATRMPDASLVKIASLGKYEFKDIDTSKDFSTPRTLIVGSGSKKYLNYQPVKTFSFPTRPVVSFIDNRIQQFPVTEAVYTIFETK